MSGSQGKGRLAWALFGHCSRERDLVLLFEVIKLKWAGLLRREERVVWKEQWGGGMSSPPPNSVVVAFGS